MHCSTYSQGALRPRARCGGLIHMVGTLPTSALRTDFWYLASLLMAFFQTVVQCLLMRLIRSASSRNDLAPPPIIYPIARSVSRTSIKTCDGLKHCLRSGKHDDEFSRNTKRKKAHRRNTYCHNTKTGANCGTCLSSRDTVRASRKIITKMACVDRITRMSPQ